MEYLRLVVLIPVIVVLIIVAILYFLEKIYAHYFARKIDVEKTKKELLKGRIK